MSSFESRLSEAGAGAITSGPLAEYGRLVLEVNQRFNVTGAKSREELLLHLLDSLTVVPYLREPYVDVGSGAGLPAIPAAIATGLPVTLIEANAKKARFLRLVLEKLGLEGTVVAARAEIAGRQEGLRERFLSGTARAVAAPPSALELLLPLLAPSGLAILQLGQLDGNERRAVEDASLVLGGEVEGYRDLAGARQLLLVRKRSPTSPRFPRRVGVPGKRPLCS